MATHETVGKPILNVSLLGTTTSINKIGEYVVDTTAGIVTITVDSTFKGEFSIYDHKGTISSSKYVLVYFGAAFGSVKMVNTWDSVQFFYIDGEGWYFKDNKAGTITSIIDLHITEGAKKYIISPARVTPSIPNDAVLTINTLSEMVSFTPSYDSERFSTVYNSTLNQLEAIPMYSLGSDNANTPAKILAIAESGKVITSPNGNFKIHVMRDQTLAEVGLVASQLYTISENPATTYEIRNWLRTTIPTTSILSELLGVTITGTNGGIINGKRTANDSIHFARFGSTYQSTNYSNPLTFKCIGFAIERV